MSRTKKLPFADALAIWCETAPEEEIRDGAVMMGIYARQRKFAFRVRIETSIDSAAQALNNFNAAVEKALPLLDGGKK
jgi:hypothetical protein